MNNVNPGQRSYFDQASLLKSIEQMAVDAGISPAAFLKSFQADLKQTPDPRRALNNAHRFFSSGFSASLLRDFYQRRVLQRIALELFSQSQYLADILVRDPELFRWLTATSVLKTTKTTLEYLSEARHAIVPFGRLEKKLDALKRFQRRELLRIGAREILEEADVSATAGELSALAEAILNVLIELTVRHFLEGSESELQSTLVVIGLGKLGGSELNFSSDIDLMFLYDDDGEFEVPHLRVWTLHEFYSRVAEFVVRKLTEHTAEGHLYRVDLRLRPEGSVGQIVLSCAGYRRYYETRGELWERQMLTKARVVAGNKAVGERLLDDLRPFVYPKTHSGSPLAEVAEIKRKIEAKTNTDVNIKLGSGGIRDIEFIVQALQLLHGGTNERLRERNTLMAIERLTEYSLLNRREQEQLCAAYKFLRVVEHRLQLLYGMQTHSLPETKEEMELLVRRLGFRSALLFQRRLEKYRVHVRTIFASVFGLRKARATAFTDSDLVSKKVLRQYGFIDVRKAAEKVGKILESFPELRDEKLFHQLLQALKRCKATQWGLQNFSLLLDNLSLKRSLLQVFKNSRLLELIVLICSRSQVLTQLLAREPLLFETLLGQPEEMMNEKIGWEFLKESDLARFKSFNEFKILVRWLVQEISIQQATCELSKLADEIVSMNCSRALRELGGITENVPVALFALGKYGGKEITIGSDLDILFIYRKQDGSSAKTAEQIARTLNALFVHERTQVYNIDMRLRPEGKSAPLAVEVSYFRDYLTRRASLWERQSLLKARVLAGDPEFIADLQHLIEKAVYKTPLSESWVKEMARMRRKIEHERTKTGSDLKVGKGGLVDIEFLVQALQIKFGFETEGLRKQNTFEALDALAKTKVLKKNEIKKLKENLEYLRSLETMARLNSPQNDFILPKDQDRLIALVTAMAEKSPSALLKRVRDIQRANRKLMVQVFRLCQS